MSARYKTGLGYGTQLNEMSNNSETDSEIILSVFDARSSDEENHTANVVSLKVDGFMLSSDEETTNLNTKTSKTVGKTNEANTQKPKTVYESVNRDKVIIEDWNSDDEDDVSEVQTVSPSQEPKLKTVVNTGPRVDKPVWDNTKRVNHQKISKYPHLRKTFVQSGVLTRTGLITPVKQNEKRAVHKVSTARPVSTVRPVSTARPVSTVRPFTPKIAQTSGVIRPIYPRMDNVRPRGSYSPIKRSYYTKPAFRPKDLKQDVKTFGVQNMTTAGTRAVVNTGKVLETQFQMFIKSRMYMDDEYVVMTRNYFLQYTQLEIPEFRETLIQHMESTTEDKVDTGKAVDASLVNTESIGTESNEQDTSSRSGNDAHADDADIRPIYNEELMAEVHTTVEINIFATGQQHTEQPEFNKEGEVDQNAEQCHDTCPLPATLTDNQTTELSNQSLESENIRLKKTIAQFQKDFLRMEAHCVNLELKYQNQALKERQHGQFLKVKNHYILFAKERESAVAKPHHMIAPSSSRYSLNDMVHNHYLDEAKKKTQESSRNSEPSVMPSARSQSTANGSKPKPRINNQKSRNWPASKSSCITTKIVPIAEHSRNFRSFSNSKHFVCSTCQKCVFNANHDSCVTKFLNEANSRSKIPKRHRSSIKKTSVVHEKTMTPRSCLRWKPTGKIFKTVGLRWVPTGKIFTSSTTKVDSEPQNGSNEDITNPYECEQTLDVSAGTLNLSAGTSFNPKMEGLRVCSELGIHDHSNEQSSSKLVPKVVPPADKTATSRQELELLFHHHITMLRIKKKCMDKGSKERSPPHNLGRNRVNTYAVRITMLIADIEDDIMDPVMQCTTLPSHSGFSQKKLVSFVTEIHTTSIDFLNIE
ncbi:hypothetical protein Tco_0223899 [Tanacetum coccineum]